MNRESMSRDRKGAVRCGVIAWICGVAILLAGCGGKEPDKAEAKSAAPAPAAQTGIIRLPADSPQLKQITVAPVETAVVPRDIVTAPGKIETNPNRVARVILPLPGRIAAVLVHLGDTVRRGQPVVQLESPDADAAVSTYVQGTATVNTAKSALLKAQADYDRVKDLYEHKAIAQKELLNAEAALAQAKAAVEQAQATQEQSRRRLELLGLRGTGFGQKLTVPAPVGGKVLDISVAPGEYRNDTNAPLMTIADLSSVYVASDVPESQIRFIQPGERLDIHLAAFPNQSFRGRVTRIADTVDPQTRTIKVRAEMDNSRGLLRPEMFGTIEHVDSTYTAPVVPNGAIVQNEGQNIVYRETQPGVFEPVKVELGNQTNGRVAVLKGLKPGDRVVVDGAMLLKQS